MRGGGVERLGIEHDGGRGQRIGDVRGEQVRTDDDVRRIVQELVDTDACRQSETPQRADKHLSGVAQRQPRGIGVGLNGGDVKLLGQWKR